MPDGVGIEMRLPLDGAGDLAHERFGVGHCSIASTFAHVLLEAHPRIIDRVTVEACAAFSSRTLA